MATVTMDLNEIDKLRDDLKKNIELVKEKEREIEAVKADKRIVRETIVKHKLTDGILWPSSELTRILQDAKVINTSGYEYIHDYEYREKLASKWLSKNISKGHYMEFSHYPSTVPPEEKTKEYINLDDLREEIRKESEEKLHLEIGQLRAKNAETEKRISELSTQYQDKILNKDREHAKLNAEQYKKYAELQQEFEDLKADKKRISREEELMEKVEELTKKLEEEQNKSWWNKLFG